MMYDVLHPLKLSDGPHARGTTVTSDQIGSPRAEVTLQRLKWIVARTVDPITNIASAAAQAPISSGPIESAPKSKGGRPKRLT